MLRSCFVFLLPASLFAASLAIKNVAVVDIDTGALKPRFTVVVTGERIAGIGPVGKVRVPRGAEVLDGSGKFLIPGLWDMHVHLWDAKPMFGLYLANGVTGLRDMGSDIRRTTAWSKDPLAPVVISSGPPLDGPDARGGKVDVQKVSTPEDARRAADRLYEQDVDFFSVLSTMPRDAYFALAHRARVLRRPFAGPVPEGVSILEAIGQRQRSMEHMSGLLIACSRKDEAREIFESFVRFKVYQTPALTLRERLSFLNTEELATDPRQKLVPEEIRKTWTDPRAALKRITPELAAQLQRDYDQYAELVREMWKAGVDLLAGTDTGDDYVLPGFSLHHELGLLCKAGLTPLAALQTATRNPARYFGLEGTYGAVAPKQVANLVLLGANPLVDIHNTQRVDAVVLRGKLLRRSRLNRMR